MRAIIAELIPSMIATPLIVTVGRRLPVETRTAWLR
jgi:hypothetical protein